MPPISPVRIASLTRYIGLVLMATLFAIGSASNAVAAKKNVLVIVADDLGRDLGCYGHKLSKTPHLDALAADGTRFDYAFCTTASCSASRSVILTGLYNHANGQYGHQHGEANFHSHARLKGVPVLLTAAGYRTASIGKFHVQPESVYQFEKTLPNPGKNPVAMAEQVAKYLAEKDDRPFFVYFCPTEPHRARKGFGNDTPHPGVTPVPYSPADVPVPHFLPDRPEVREELAEYLQAVNRVDQGVGRLVEILKQTGTYNNTLILFLSDNGIPFPGAKTTLYDPGTRLPLIVRSPDQTKRGVVAQAMVNWTDLVPTILDFTQSKGPNYPLHGQSFLNVLDGQTPKTHDHVFASHTFHEITMYYPMRSIRTRKYKLIYNVAHPLPFPFASDLYASKTWQGVLERKDTQYGSRTVAAYVQRPKFELYDLEADPHEVSNVADSPRYAEVLADLQTRLRKFQEETKDPWRSKYQYE